MQRIEVRTRARTEFVDVTDLVANVVADSGLQDGIVNVFVPHTTAGVTINENADPDVLTDMTTIFDTLVPWRGNYRHCEGNAAAHAKATLAGNSVTLIVESGIIQLGTWQGIYLCEFDGPRHRQVWVKAVNP